MILDIGFYGAFGVPLGAMGGLWGIWGHDSGFYGVYGVLLGAIGDLRAVILGSVGVLGSRMGL